MIRRAEHGDEQFSFANFAGLCVDAAVTSRDNSTFSHAYFDTDNTLSDQENHPLSPSPSARTPPPFQIKPK
jgi:hypothetical protein